MQGRKLQFNELQEYYLQRRRTGAQSRRQDDIATMNREGYHEGLEDFQSVLTTFTRYRYAFINIIYAHNSVYALIVFIELIIFFVPCHVWISRLRVIAELRHGDLFHTANIVSR
jgi:E3 ubiquitin-protein ligase RFWD2